MKKASYLYATENYGKKRRKETKENNRDSVSDACKSFAVRVARLSQILILIDRWDSEDIRFLGREEKSNFRFRWVNKDFWNKEF
jgi:hypothetical protein